MADAQGGIRTRWECGLALAEMLGHRQESLNRLLLVREPGEAWVRVVELLAAGVDVVLLRPPAAVAAGLRRPGEAWLRQGRSAGRASAGAAGARAVAGAAMTLRTVQTVWTGLSGVGPRAGTGHLTGCKATVTALGRATAGRPRVVRLRFPGRTARWPCCPTTRRASGGPRGDGRRTA